MAPTPTYPLSRTRRALVQALAAGASVEELAAATDWTPERVRREAAAAIDQLDPHPRPEAPLAPHAAARDGATQAPGEPASTDAAAPPTAPADASTTLPERPALAPEVVIEPAPPGADHRVVHDPRSGRYARMKLPQAAFLESLDGERTLDELRADGSLPRGLALALVAKFAELGLLAGVAGAERRPPASARGGASIVRLAVFDPEPLLARARPLIGAAGTLPALAAAALAVVLGAVAVIAHLDAGLLTSERLADPVVLATLLAALLATAMVHELGHAAAVTFFGGRVKRMGFMLFYLLPALFCDTSDAWRFPFAWQRVVVALAGIVTQLVAVGLVAQVLWLPIGEDVAAWIVLFVLVNLGMCVYNLIPLVKLDGYWALSAAIDRPNLRATAIARASAWARRLALGEPLRRERSDAALVAFGAASALFAPALVVYALLRWEDLLLRLGVAGATLWLLVAAIVVARPAQRAWVAARTRLAEPGAPRGRAAASLGALVAGAAAVAALVPVPTSAGGTLERSGAHGRYLADVSSGAVALVRRGARADLGARSLTSGRVEARGTVVRRRGDRWVVALGRGQRAPRGDDVTVRTGSQPVASWLWHAHLRPALRASWP